MIIILVIIGVLSILYYYAAVKPYNYWAKKNVKTGHLTPIVGDSMPLLMGKESVTEMILRIYNRVPEARVVGSVSFSSVSLMLRSPDVIKLLGVKDYDYALDHKNFLPDGVEDLWCKNLMGLRGKEWKNMRSTLSPAFTSSKIKSMMVLICENCELFAQYFLKQNKDIIEVEMKDALTRITTDIIATTAFGLQVDSLGDKENEFYMMGKEASDFNSLQTKICYYLYQICPDTCAALGIPFFTRQMRSFFVNLVRDTIKTREEKQIKRPDMLQLLLEARKGFQREEKVEGEKDSFAAVEEHLQPLHIAKPLTDMDIASQVFVFFLAGFESVSTSMCFTAYELAINPDVQEKLIKEIDENKPKNGMVTYETIMGMTYLDMVISESLRKWPAAAVTDRIITKPYTIQPVLPDEKPVHIEMDTSIIIPIIGLHRDPKYYPNPEKFDPERFSPENRKSIDPYTYMPFGVGPRNCVGSRLALLEIKIMFFYLLTHFEILTTKETKVPLVINKEKYNIASENGFPLALKRRS